MFKIELKNDYICAKKLVVAFFKATPDLSARDMKLNSHVFFYMHTHNIYMFLKRDLKQLIFEGKNKSGSEIRKNSNILRKKNL